MGKRIIAQARGHGSLTYRAPSHRYVGRVRYRALVKGNAKGIIADLINDPGRSTPIAKLAYDDGVECLVPAAHGMQVKAPVSIGDDAVLAEGNVMPLGNIPAGLYAYNIELTPGDGGKIVRASGGFAIIMSHEGSRTVIKLPSKKLKTLDSRCRSTLGVAAGSNRKARPFAKAGKKHHAMRARGKLYPRTSARAMNAVDHKFGGSNLGVTKTSSRHAPPGRKVGSIAAKATGRKGKH